MIGYLAVPDETHDHLLAGLAFGIGFIALLLAHSERFTEHFLMPIAAVAAKQGSVPQLLTLWLGTLVANLAGGWIFMQLVVLAFPQWHDVLTESGQHFTSAPLSVRTVVLAVPLAGRRPAVRRAGLIALRYSLSTPSVKASMRLTRPSMRRWTISSGGICIGAGGGAMRMIAEQFRSARM